MGIYVETRIRCTMDKLWEYTQRPELHQQWDLRFSSIEYLPRPDPAQPQQFSYSTRIGFGLSIDGFGETVGERERIDGQRTSALKFWSDDPKSLILTGSGYWQYRPDGDGVIFLTWYDYQTRFGLFGQIIDRLFFRPLIGWATAWSFDQLRLWLESNQHPQTSQTKSLLRYGFYLLLTLAIGYLLQYLLPHQLLALGEGLLLASMLLRLFWPSPTALPAARRCRRAPLT